MHKRLPIHFVASLACAAASIAGAAPPMHKVPDTIAQRVLACTPCHGKEGVASNQGYRPRIAGKPAGYLYNQLQNFRDGRRNNDAMAKLIENMSDAYLLEIAGYFSTLDLPYPAPPAQAAAADDLARGERLVKQGDAALALPACNHCHGAAMTGVAPAIPGLLGLPKDYLVAQLGAWRTGLRRAKAPDCMREISLRLTAQDLGAVAAYLSMQAVLAGVQSGAALPKALPPSLRLDCAGMS
jgi:cytochrome c553